MQLNSASGFQENRRWLFFVVVPMFASVEGHLTLSQRVTHYCMVEDLNMHIGNISSKFSSNSEVISKTCFLVTDRCVDHE